MKSHQLATLVLCFYHCAFAASVQSNDASNSNAANPLNGAPTNPLPVPKVADFIGEPSMPDVDLRRGAAVGGAAALEMLRQGVNGAEKVLNPTSEKDDSIPLTGQETWQAETLCPQERFGVRIRSICDNGNILDVSYAWPIKAWILRNAEPCPCKFNHTLLCMMVSLKLILAMCRVWALRPIRASVVLVLQRLWT